MKKIIILLSIIIIGEIIIYFNNSDTISYINDNYTFIWNMNYSPVIIGNGEYFYNNSFHYKPQLAIDVIDSVAEKRYYKRWYYRELNQN